MSYIFNNTDRKGFIEDIICTRLEEAEGMDLTDIEREGILITDSRDQGSSLSQF